MGKINKSIYRKFLNSGVGIVLLLLSFVVSCEVYTTYKENKEKDKLLESVKGLQSELTKTKDEYGREVAKVKSLTDASILEGQTHDSLTNLLKEQIKTYKKKLKEGGSVTVVSTSTNVNETTKIDTIYVDSNGVKTLVDSMKQTAPWITGIIKVTGDSIVKNFKIKNEIAIVIGREGGLFKKPSYTAQVTQLNPYSNVEGIRSYQVEAPKEHKLTIFGIGISVGIITTLLILK